MLLSLSLFSWPDLFQFCKMSFSFGSWQLLLIRVRFCGWSCYCSDYSAFLPASWPGSHALLWDFSLGTAQGVCPSGCTQPFKAFVLLFNQGLFSQELESLGSLFSLFTLLINIRSHPLTSLYLSDFRKCSGCHTQGFQPLACYLWLANSMQWGNLEYLYCWIIQ